MKRATIYFNRDKPFLLVHIGADQVPLLFEALPPPAAATPREQDAYLAALAPLAELPAAGLLVPHVEDGDYATIDPRTFARALRDATGKPAAVAKVTVDQPLPDLLRWVDETRREHGIRDLLLVGGRSHRDTPVGPHVHTALRHLRADPDCGSLGVVTIPTRRRSLQDEPHRLLRKRRAGAHYAVSQILMEPDTAIDLRRGHVASLAPDEAPTPVYWSLAPVTRRSDIRFLERLGVHFPPEVRKALWDAPDRKTRIRLSIEHATGIAANILAAAQREGHGATGFCISHVTVGNLDAALSLLAAVGRLLQRPPEAAQSTAVPASA